MPNLLLEKPVDLYKQAKRLNQSPMNLIQHRSRFRKGRNVPMARKVLSRMSRWLTDEVWNFFANDKNWEYEDDCIRGGKITPPLWETKPGRPTPFDIQKNARLTEGEKDEEGGSDGRAI